MYWSSSTNNALASNPLGFMNKVGRLYHFEFAFKMLGWFIPPFAQMGFLSRIAGEILRSDSQFSDADLELELSSLYEPHGLAAMVTHRYPVIPYVSQYEQTIAEAVEAHFLGLHHVATGGLISVIEGAGRQLLDSRNLGRSSIVNVFATLAKDCERQAIRRGIGATGEVLSMLASFSTFTSDVLYADSKRNPPADGTNRHGISHGHFRDSQYGRPLNFFKTIGAIDFLLFIASFNANMSWFAPDPSEKSELLAVYYETLQTVGHSNPRTVAYP